MTKGKNLTTQHGPWLENSSGEVCVQVHLCAGPDGQDGAAAVPRVHPVVREDGFALREADLVLQLELLPATREALPHCCEREKRMGVKLSPISLPGETSSKILYTIG